MPRSIKIYLQNDLVDKVKPGDRVRVTGLFRAKMRSSEGGNKSALTDNFIIATGISQLNHEKEKPNLNETDIKNIKKISKEKDVFSILGNSIASSIEGNEAVKRALLL